MERAKITIRDSKPITAGPCQSSGYTTTLPNRRGYWRRLYEVHCADDYVREMFIYLPTGKVCLLETVEERRSPWAADGRWERNRLRVIAKLPPAWRGVLRRGGN